MSQLSEQTKSLDVKYSDMIVQLASQIKDSAGVKNISEFFGNSPQNPKIG